MTEVYVVIGNIGEYSDAREWCVRAFDDRERAEKFAADAKEHAESLARDEEYRERVAWGDPTGFDLDRLALFDTTLVYTIETGPRAGQRVPVEHWTYCSDSPRYTVCPVPMEVRRG